MVAGPLGANNERDLCWIKMHMARSGEGIKPQYQRHCADEVVEWLCYLLRCMSLLLAKTDMPMQSPDVRCC